MTRSPFAYAEKPIRVTEIVLAEYDDLAQVYQDPESAAGPQTVTISKNIATAVQQIAGRDADVASLLQSYMVSGMLTGVDISILKILTGGYEEAMPSVNDTHSNFYERDAGDGDPGYPPFGVVMITSTKNGVFTAGFPKVVLESAEDMEFQGTGVDFSGMGFTARALFEDIRGASGDPFATTFRRFKNRADFSTPTTAADFKAYFTEDLGSAAPVANFTSVISNREVTFTDTSTGVPTSWYWDFGDGYFSTEDDPVHEYQTAGTRTVTLVARNAGGRDTHAVAVTVS